MRVSSEIPLLSLTDLRIRVIGHHNIQPSDDGDGKDHPCLMEDNTEYSGLVVSALFLLGMGAVTLVICILKWRLQKQSDVILTIT